MINILKTGNAIVIDFTDNDKYLHNGTIEVAPNELMIVIDESNMATFKKMSNGDTLFGLLIDLILIQGENVTKDNIIDKFGIIGFTSGGGGTGGAVNSVNGQTGDVVITATSLGAITKADADAAYASKTELEGKQEVFQVNAPMAFNRDEATLDLHLSIDLSGYATKEELTSKADTSAIADMATQTWVTSQGYLTEIPSEYVTDSELTEALADKLDKGDYALKSDLDNLATKEELAAKADASALSTKLDTLVSGTNIKTINGETILGSGNIEISSGGPVDTEMSDTSENAVLNKVIKKYIDDLVGNILTQLQEINGTN